MIRDRLSSARSGSWRVVGLGLLLGFAAPAAAADTCPGHPDAIGTSRTIVVDPREHPRIGTMQYSQTLPLRDHEVVLTFDDGPVPRNSNQILQILADNCVKATFFTIGQQALANPEGVRKLAAAGHTIGTHSQHHPLKFEKMPMDKVKQEVDDGIASVSAALPDPSLVAPFFRVPGLLRGANVEEYLASKGIQIWSADFLADDWRHISPQRVYELAIKRLEEKGKGILLLHDIQARTVAALPKILHEMKARGYHIVQVVPATPERPATPTDPQEWQLHPPTETVPIARWPKVPNFVFADAGASALAAPELSNFDAPDEELLLSAEPFEHARRFHGVPLPQEAPWPRTVTLPLETKSVTLPVPEQSLFEMPQDGRAAFLSPPPRVALATDEPEAKTEAREAAPDSARHARMHAGHSPRRTRRSTHAAQDEPRDHVNASSSARRRVRMASLKRR
jgi:peptidoglycan/xylan/chitin deacetylase (PgdA/CDA1 family)